MILFKKIIVPTSNTYVLDIPEELIGKQLLLVIRLIKPSSEKTTSNIKNDKS